jgi:hypothetical protein
LHTVFPVLVLVLDVLLFTGDFGEWHGAPPRLPLLEVAIRILSQVQNDAR